MSKIKQNFALSVIRPVKGKPGVLVCELSLAANSVTEAVSRARDMFQGSGYVVVQTASLRPSVAETDTVKESEE